MIRFPNLPQVLGRWDIAALTINSTVGAGILGLPGPLYALLGPYSVLACLAGGVLMGMVACCHAEAASRIGGTGGSILYASAAFGPSAGFAAGWLAIAARLLSFASIANLATSYASAAWAPLGEPGGRIAVITALAWGLGGVIAAGVRLSGRVNGAFTLAKLGLLIGFVALAGWAAWPFHPAAWPPVPAASQWAPGLVLMLFALVGMDSAVVNGGEMRDPRRAVPFGLGVGMGVVVALYAAILLACAAVVPGLAASHRPVFDGAAAMLGASAGRAVALAAALIMCGTLFSLLFTGSRLVLALADARMLPPALARLDARAASPRAAVLAITALAWLLALGTSFLGSLAASTVVRLLLYALTSASLVRLRARGISHVSTPLLLPGGLAMAVAATLICLWLTTQESRAAWAMAAGCLAVGGLVLAVRRQA